MTDTREFRFEEKHFLTIRETLYRLTGITLGDHKRDMVYSRLARRLRTLELPDFEAYCRLLTGPESESEITHLVNALTTNLTHFFRESHHFDHLGEHLDACIAAADASGQRRLRIWSAGCSTGEEPYSIAMMLHDRLGNRLSGFDARILATDIDTKVLDHAREGVYRDRQVRGIPDRFRKRYTDAEGDGEDLVLHMRKDIRELIAFKQLNLFHQWPMKGPFDAIFCRNVLIYFDRDGRRQVVEQCAGLLADHGMLYLGHSESLHNVTDLFIPAGRTIWSLAQAQHGGR